jgi:hypothetical protein
MVSIEEHFIMLGFDIPKGLKTNTRVICLVLHSKMVQY